MNMRLFAENPEKYIQQYSNEFESAFLDLVRKKYIDKKVLANRVYQEFISNKMHTHLNATKWPALTTFIEYLAEAGKVTTEWTNEGLFIELNETSTETIAKKKAEEEKILKQLKKEEKDKKAMDAQIEIANKFKSQTQEQNKQLDSTESEPAAVSMHPISFSLTTITNQKTANPLANKDGVFQRPALQPNVMISLGQAKPLGTLEFSELPEDSKSLKRDPIQDLEKSFDAAKPVKKVKAEGSGISIQNPSNIKPQADGENEEWIAPDIVVKVKDKKLANYYKKKGKIVRIAAPFVAEVQMIEGGAKIQLDQDFLETVIPAIGNKVKVLKKGPYFGEVAVMESVHQDNFSVSVLTEQSKVALELPYEKVSKLA